MWKSANLLSSVSCFRVSLVISIVGTDDIESFISSSFYFRDWIHGLARGSEHAFALWSKQKNDGSILWTPTFKLVDLLGTSYVNVLT